MTVTVDSFLKTYEKFSIKPRPAIQDAINAGIAECPPDRWKERTEGGVKLFAAHLLSMDWWETMALAGASASLAGGGPAKVPTSITGDLDADLDLTHYGRLFKRERARVAIFNKGPHASGYIGFSL